MKAKAAAATTATMSYRMPKISITTPEEIDSGIGEAIKAQDVEGMGNSLEDNCLDDLERTLHSQVSVLAGLEHLE